MKKNKILFTVLIILFLTVLVLFPSVCFAGAKTGLILWFETVLPVLFPFFIVTYLMNHFKITDSVNMVLYPFFKRIFKISPSGSFPILLGFLSGFPIGAKACANEVKSGRLGIAEGQYILSFCNNVSPAFLSGYLSLQIIGKKGLWPLIIVDAAAVLCAFTLRLFFLRDKHTALLKNKESADRHDLSKENKITLPCLIRAFDDALISAAEILVKIGGYIIIFSVLQKIILSFAAKYSGGSGLNLFLVLIASLMEVTSGIAVLNEYLTKYPLILPFFTPDTIKTALILMSVSFGGLSAMAQTKSVIMESGLSLKKYFLTRIINAVYALFISVLLLSLGIF